MVTDDDVVALIGEGVDVNVTDAMGKSALLLAAGNGHVEVVRALLDAGANPNLAYTSGATALHWAALNGHAEVVAMLLGVNGIDTTLKDSNGRTAFTVAAAADHTDIYLAYTFPGAAERVVTPLSSQVVTHDFDHEALVPVKVTESLLEAFMQGELVVEVWSAVEA